ncbi:MAG TPA: hypothetical protein VGK78_04735 [Nocardioides sp.]|uniref:hypothetical protein n=1 Tax=Nocardioides sp. TaxID=35761 RepID=UPI002F411E57
MIFYGFLVLVGLGTVVWLIRSPVARQARRGHFTDPGQNGDKLDQLNESRMGSAGDFDASGGKRESDFLKRRPR